MDFQKLITRFRQFGGMRLVWQYAKLGALWPAVKAGVRCLVKGQSFKGIYPEVLKRVDPFLVERSASVLKGMRDAQKSQENLTQNLSKTSEANTNRTNDTNEIPHHVRSEGPKTIWWCWLQGIENAPEIVKACYNSLKQLTGYSLVVIDNTNWREYVELPGFIVGKWEKGRIPAAMFSDLLRVELLIWYGGTWIDSTVLCTGFGTQKSQIPRKEETNTNLTNYTNNSQLEHFMNADLFLFQYTKEGSVPVSISNWFITACRNNEVLMVLREMLFAYWRDYDCVLDYYIFHLFFAMISKEYPEQMAAMPYAQSQRSLVLLHH